MNGARLLGGRLSSWPIIGLLAMSTSGWSYSGGAPGDLLWEDTVAGSHGGGDTALAVSVFGAQVFAAGFIQSLGEGKFAVRAYDAQSGELIWADQPSSTGPEDQAADVHAFANEVAVCGVLDDGKFAVLAYDRHTGGLLWEDRSVGGKANACEGHGGKLFAVGTTLSSATGFDFSIRAYEARTGVLLWEDRFDGGAAVADVANALSVAGGQLYVVGRIQQTAGDDDLLIRRYDLNTGALIWQQVFAGPAGERDDGIAVAIGRHRVFVGGFAAHVPGVSQWAVHAYRASTGELVWSDYRDGEQVAAITARGDGVIAAGQQGDRAVVRAYDAATGILLWDDVLGQNSIAAAVDTDHRFAYWGGQTETSTGGNPALIVRAVDLETGAIAWQDVGPQAGGRVNDLAVTAQRVVAVGHTTVGPGVPQSGSVGDFLVRAYSTR
jgi:outer membrane protein assembly factor BamB